MAYVLILGASSDVAVACAREFAKHGYNLYLAGRSMDSLEARSVDFNIRYGITAKAISFDALQFERHDDFYKALDPKPEITICVFGLLGDQAASEKNWTDCKRVIDSNFTGAVSILNCVARDYQENRKGIIVGISSVAGERGRQSNYIYGSAKAGFTAYLSGLRNRMVSFGVHVITVKPGFIHTKMTEGLNLPKPITAEPGHIGLAIFKAVKNRKNVVYVLPVWRVIMMIIRNIPEAIFKRLKL